MIPITSTLSATRQRPAYRQLPVPSLVIQKEEGTCRLILVGRDQRELYDLSDCLGGMYAISTATNEKDALQLIENQNIHLIISSLQLTDVEGIQFCAHLKSSVLFSHIPVILLMDSSFSRIRGLQSGADVCIERPLSKEYLKAQTVNLLANRARLKAYFTHCQSVPSDDNLSCPDEDEAFLKRLHALISAYLNNKDLDVDALARSMNMTRPTFYRKVRSVSELTPNELINLARLNKAAELLSTARYKVFEVVEMVGFHSKSNFGKAFQKQFHATPTEYRRSTCGRRKGGA